MLTIMNWSGTPVVGGGIDQLFFGNDPSALTAAQIPEIMFDLSGSLTPGILLSNGEFVPVPEPGSLVAVAALLGLIGWRGGRRL